MPLRMVLIVCSCPIRSAANDRYMCALCVHVITTDQLIDQLQVHVTLLRRVHVHVAVPPSIHGLSRAALTCAQRARIALEL